MSALRSEAQFGPYQEHRDPEGQLHCMDGPALISPTRIEYRQNGRLHGPLTDFWGSVIYYFKGVLIPKHFFTDPEKLSVDDILSHPNTEVRRVGLEIYGIERLLNEGKCNILDEEEGDGTDGRGRKLIQIDIGDGGEEPSTFVMVYNGSLEPDGSRKTYYLAVPPNMRTCREAVAWTFEIENPKEYAPQQET